MSLATLILVGCDGTNPHPTPPSEESTAETATSPDTETPPSSGPVLVVPGGAVLSLVDAGGATVWSAAWDGLIGSCAACDGEGASPDGDGLLVSFTTSHGPPFPGGIARLDASLALDFRLDGFTFPHDVVRDPTDGALVIPETTDDQISWVAGDGSSTTPLRALNGADGLAPLPNGVERLEFAGRTFLLNAHRGNSTAPGAGPPLGSVSLWDITDPATPALQWTFPASGALSTPHGPALRFDGARWWLLYAHTSGAADETGTVGLAVTDDPTVLPAYVADLTVPAGFGPLVFLRGVEWAPGGPLIFVDSGIGGQNDGRLLSADFPDLPATGASGGAGTDQVYVEMTGVSVLQGEMDSPFEAFWWTAPAR